MAFATEQPRWDVSSDEPVLAHSEYRAVEDVVRFKEAGAVTEVIAVSCDEPRYVTLPNIMKAKKKPLEVLPPRGVGR